MTTVKLYHDKRRANGEGKYPVRLAVTSGRKTFYITLGVNCTSTDKLTKLQHSMLENQLLAAQRIANSINKEGIALQIPEVKERMMIGLGFSAPSRATIVKYLRICSSLHKGNTKKLYDITIKKVLEFGDAGLDDINKLWLERFDIFLSKTNKSANSRSIYMRNIRAAFNKALDERETTNYPFRTFKIKKEETLHAPLSLSELVKFIKMPLTADWQIEARDIWLLSFYLGGINMVDLANLKALTKGRVVYRRQKTGKMYDIVVCEEARMLLEKYKGKNYLVNILDRNKDYKEYLIRLNRNIKTIGKTIKNGCRHQGDALFPQLTYYDARRTLATIAYEIGVSVDEISDILGHTNGMAVTNLYIRKSQERIDNALLSVYKKVREQLSDCPLDEDKCNN